MVRNLVLFWAASRFADAGFLHIAFVNAGDHADRYSLIGEYAHGFQGNTLRGGVEYRPGMIELRGGGVYSRELWNPTGGVGLNFSPKVGLDVALYSTTANAARERHAAVALSLRISSMR